MFLLHRSLYEEDIARSKGIEITLGTPFNDDVKKKKKKEKPKKIKFKPKTKWERNKSQAFRRFLAGRKLSEKTKKKYNLDDDFLKDNESRVNVRVKYSYDKKSYRRRFERYNVALSSYVKQKYNF